MGSVRKLMVEVIDARNLVPKDGHGASSPYAILDFHGQRRKTRTVLRDLNPTWNETLEFNVGKTSDVFGDMLELDLFHDKNVGPTTRTNFLGRVRLSSSQFVKKGEEALIYYPLQKKSLLSWIQGEIGLKIYFADVVVPPPAPPPPPKPAAPPADAQKNIEPSPEEKPAAEAAEDPIPHETEHQVDHPPPPPPPHEEAEPVLDPPKDQVPSDDQVMMASISITAMPEVKINNINGPQPISRVSSVSSFISDQSDRSTIERSSFDLVEKMHYLFVRVVRARSLPTAGSPVVKIAVSGFHVVSKPARKTAFFDWDQTFAFNRDSQDSSSILEVSVWDPIGADVGHDFLGGICFDVGEIPLRDPPDSPLAPQWYRLEGGGAHRGDLMLATWLGTQADESFPDAWKTDTSANSRSKVYQSPKLWYLRSTVVEAQDISMLTRLKDSSFQVKVQLGFQVQKTKTVATSSGAPSWNEDLMFVAAEPFTAENSLTFFLIEHRPPKEQAVVGIARVPLTAVERRVDDRNVVSKWFTLEDPNEEKRASYRGRVHLRLCFDGGYHVMDEGAHVCSDYRPTARQLWKPPIGTIELGIIGCKNLLPMKTIKGKGSTDAYAVAKYGNKWVRTRTISDTLEPRWNEQYTWRVYDPSTVLTVGVFDSWEVVFDSEGSMESVRPDFRIGKVRIRISTLTTAKVYKSVFPLILLSQAGLKKMGEIELAVRFVRSSPTLDFLHVYSQPLLPAMHHLKPLGMVQQEALRGAAMKIVAAHLSLSEPPLRREVVSHMLDHADSNSFSMRKVRANWYRIIHVIAGVVEVFRWVDDTRSWKNPTATMLVHALLVMLVWFPDLIVPTLALYVFSIGAWNYRFRSRASLPHFDPKMSLAESVERDELEEEFDAMPCSRPNEVVRARYDKLRMLGARVQTMLGDIATQGERVQALVTWRDPRATGIFVAFCFMVAFVLYLVPSKMVAMALGFYYLRHPIFRDRMPSPALNFFRRLPSLSDRML
ncbi:C2 calcium/lipid-binding plant phosphoribosyltransferase family protein [Perilla frutescens var. hirtella]|uniref:C2 calcium/lipid-binding plant phosphoribosyltransferase family protein n=1 Tax=Perilla frutescens var. hirtella TaxID=608512 RepID=A0AAD4P500_PERFH|nr:C2 calcium/lipid-binding plant phosphoribosyltransferase family protein [Perilla frutescens var. hirtella]